MIFETLVVATAIFVAIYAYMTHPDTRGMPPGPRGFPIVGSAHKLINRDSFRALAEISAEYGDVCSVQFGTRRVVLLSSSEAIQQAFAKQGENFSHRPTGTLLSKALKGRGVVGSEGDLWKEHRRFLLQVMRDFGLGKRTMEDRVTTEAMQLVKQIQEASEKPYDPHTDIAAAVLNVVWSITAGLRYDPNDPKLKWLIETLEYNMANMDLAGPLNYFPWLQLMMMPLKGNLPTLLGKIIDLQKHFVQLVDDHKASYAEDLRNTDIVHSYIGKQRDFEAQGVESSFTDEQIHAVVGDLFVGGVDTTMTALRWAMLHLAMHEHCQNKARHELSSAFGSEFPKYEKRTETPYLEAIINETLRWSTIAPIISHANPEECYMNGYRIPRRTWVVANLWAANRDPAVWPEPEKFKPERFISAENKLHGTEKIMTFSTGRRSCLGEAVARIEMYIFLAAMIQKFKWKLDPASPKPDLNGKSGITWSPHDYLLLMTPVSAA